jgi:hypothetical protein
MDKQKLIYAGILATAFILLLMVFAQAYRWTSTEAIVSRYVELKNERDTETLRLNIILKKVDEAKVEQCKTLLGEQDANS